jgi:deoxyribodipyrimidine photolyase-related protein
LSRGLSALRDIDGSKDVVLMAELWEEATYVRHHKQKRVLLLSAMRHFAEELRREGIRVDYVPVDSPANSGRLSEEVRRAIRRHKVKRLVVTESGEWRTWESMQRWKAELGLVVDIRADDRFLTSKEDFADWAGGKHSLRMEYF